MADPHYHDEDVVVHDEDVVVQGSNPVPALMIGILVIVALLIVLWAAGFSRTSNTNVTNVQPGASAGGGAGASLSLPSVGPATPAPSQ